MAVEEQETTAVAERPRYIIDRSWFDARGVSFDDVLFERVCDSCRGRMDEQVEERFTSFDKKSGRMSFDVRRVAYGSNKLRVIRECCSKKKGYIIPDMPTLEVVFRILLANGNQPMPLEHVREQLAEWCPGGGCQWLMLQHEVLERLVDHDRYYGLCRHEGAS